MKYLKFFVISVPLAILFYATGITMQIVKSIWEKLKG